jgi:tetraacyldisaccharide 4'-kinase
LPRGLLREPLSSLRRADLVLITRCDQVSNDELAAIRRELLKHRGTPDCVEVRFAPRQLRNAAGEIRPLSLLQTERCLPFSGIGNPEGFRRMLAGLGVYDAPMIFPDHHHYRPADLTRLAQRAHVTDASLCVTTQKDLVKFSDNRLSGRPLWAVEIAAEVMSGAELLDGTLSALPDARRFAA